MPEVTYLITFSCKHTFSFPDPPPKVGELLWCRKCQVVREVEFAPAEYRIRCEDCIYARPFGVAKLQAEIAAAKHRLKRSGHVVRIYDGVKLVNTFGNRDQTVIPLTSDSDQKPPF